MSYQLWQGIYVVNIEPGARNYCKCGKTNDLDSVYKRYGILGKVKAHLEPVSDPDYAEALIFLLLFPFRNFEGQRGLETLKIPPIVAIDIVKWVCIRTNMHGREIKDLQMTRTYKQATAVFTKFQNSYSTVYLNIRNSLLKDLNSYWSQNDAVYLNAISSRINSWQNHCKQHFMKSFKLNVGTFNILQLVEWYKQYKSTNDSQLILPFEEICTILGNTRAAQIKLN